MTEYEMASLHAEIFNSIQASLTVFISVMSGFLVISVLFAHKLDWITAAVFSVALLGFETLIAMGIAAQLRTYAGLSAEMQAFAAAGGGLSWHNTNDMPLAIVHALRPAWLAASAVILLSAALFFLSSRRKNRAGA